MIEDINFKIKEKEYTIKVKTCVTTFSKTLGLMFQKNSKPLLFKFKKPTRTSLHSFFCKPFIAIWFLNNTLIEIKLIYPNQLSIKPKHEFNQLLEIPSNCKEFKFFVDKETFKY